MLKRTLLAATIATLASGVNAQILGFNETTLSGSYIIDMMAFARQVDDPCQPDIVQSIPAGIHDYGCAYDLDAYEFMADIDHYLEFRSAEVLSVSGWRPQSVSMSNTIEFVDGYRLVILAGTQDNAAILMGLPAQAPEVDTTYY